MDAGQIESGQKSSMSKALQSRVITLTIYGERRAGKSTLAANLAAYLARYFPVMLVDLDINNHRAASLHGVKLTPDEPGVLQAWLAALDGAPNPPQPAVKPSAKVGGVYVMLPGPVAGDELQRKYNYSPFEDAAMKLHSIIINQAEIYRTPLVIIDTPPWGVEPILAKSDMALVVVPASAGALCVFEKKIMALDGRLLSERTTFVVVNKEDEPINIAAPFPVYHLPYSPEVGLYSRHRHIFIMYRPGTNSGYRWQIAFSELAETVARMARLMMDQLKEIDEIVNSARKKDKIADLLREYERAFGTVKVLRIVNKRNEP